MARRARGALFFVALAALAGGAAACASSLSSFSAPEPLDSGVTFDSSVPSGLGAGNGGDAGNIVLGLGNDGSALTGTLTVAPTSPVVSVTIDSAGVHTTPLTFTAQNGGATIGAAWSVDRGDLGAIGTATGIFTASGQNAGVGTITANAGGLTGLTSVTVQIHSIENGAPAEDGGLPEAGLGGNGGVGGAPLGGGVPPGTVGGLQDAGSADAGLAAGTFTWLYPYDQTVWPQGLLPPLLQWLTPPTPATAVYIHLTEANFEFEGFYSGANLVNQPIDPTAWAQATNSNGGDPLHVEVTVTDGTNFYGPIAENWFVAPGLLKGVVYYSSYNTQFAQPVYGTTAAAILSIRLGLTSPELAIPGSETKCLVCHEVSGDGNTLFTSSGQAYPDYAETDAYDLATGSGTATQTYTGDAPDGTINDRKFLWSGVWKDGSFALQSSGLTQESYGDWPCITAGCPAGTPPPDTDSRVFERSDGNAIAAPGFDGQVKQAVTPAFSPDGTKVAFNFLVAQPEEDAGLAQGNGHTLDLMDFACGTPQDAGSPPNPSAGPGCGSLQFSGLRRLYTNPLTTNGFPAWPAWLPDSSGIVFHNTVLAPTGTSPISTWDGAEAELWFVNATASPSSPAPQAVALQALNGVAPSGTSYLPTNAEHPNDAVLNFEPTVSPIPSGGYFWVVFTSRRMYGNVAAGDPYDVGNGTYPVNKKLWVAAIDLHPTPGQDPSHPAFYLPAQELDAPNMRGFWEPAPCASNGASCTTGDECCGGYCQQGPSGSLVCTTTTPTCSGEYDKCTQTSDCCGAAQGYTCINSVCAMPPPH